MKGKFDKNTVLSVINGAVDVGLVVMIVIVALLAALLVSSCESMPESWNWGGRARPLTGTRGFPEADTDYGRGFRDGCESALKTTGQGGFRILDNRVNGYSISSSDLHSSGWWDGYEQCTYVLDHDVV